MRPSPVDASLPSLDETAERILLSAPDVGELEREYVLAAMRSGWVAPAGPDLHAFESEVAERVGVAHAVGLSSGTAALHLALVSWGVGPGDVVPVSTLTFAATVNAIRYVGAEPFFVDCDEESGNMSPSLLRQSLTHLRSEGRHVPAVVPVDLLGKAVQYGAITEVTQEFEARLLSDAAESFGSTWQGLPTGSFGDASVLSFNGNKVMTTSGGGMMLTNDEALAVHVRKLSTQAREPVVHYEHNEVGYNYRLSNILAALGRAQLTRLDEMIARRRSWRERYRNIFREHLGVRILGGEDDSQDNCWLTGIVVDPHSATFSARELGAALRLSNIETRPIWKPMHLQPVSRGIKGIIDGTSEKIFDQGLTLPSGSAMTEEQFGRLIAQITRVIG
ncbi:aminotransferase class I/II-fold pyridoxal phosphate-dependent enzyme [Ornithinimicrobium flavum]|uniref:aminotransferase class I/II-fold pyridoxal phosphate-dependent enzyme n=1 Tax=Ornithinimicrobium flavum TaxID=1288636 RepID=UPI001EE935AB|nr:aminotransferase class I/II-fold pyridoxal phosphate-dependent enzyme [Ornithinimicrobium flavum]